MSWNLKKEYYINFSNRFAALENSNESQDVNMACENINPLKTKRRPLYLKIQSVPRCKHFLSQL